MIELPDEILERVTGGKLSEYERNLFREVAQKLKAIDISEKNAYEWLYMETEGCRYSDEDLEEIKKIVKSVYEE